ncbi:MAG: selenide, water dikinase SelD [Candidatus Puniceispirillales bacterium]
MKSTPKQPDLQHLVLLGGGHAQVAVLKDLAMRPIPGLRVTLISRDIMTPYSGMLPGFMEGCYTADEITIDLSHLARHAGARFIHGEVRSLNADAKTITLAGRPPLHFDLLSINIGSSPDPNALPGAAAHATPIKPISTLVTRFEKIIRNSEGQRIAIIGGGAAGVEVALALHQRLHMITGTAISIFHRGPRLVPEYPEQAARMLASACHDRGIDIHCGKAVTTVAEDHLLLDDNSRHAIDQALLVTAGRAPSWLAETGLDLDDDGFIRINAALQSTSHDSIFAAGDIAGLSFAPRPKAGVFAVRAGKPLAENLRRSLHGQPLTPWRPQSRYLALIGLGGGVALPVRGSKALPPSRLAWQLKEWIDRRFMARYSDLPAMPPPPKPALARQIPDDDDPALLDMRCLGCGAKAGYGTLSSALAEAASATRSLHPDAAPLEAITSDSSSISIGKARIIQSVDAISALVDDPYRLGCIAARHAMSDLFASHAQPLNALAIITLPAALARLQQDDISQIMAGAMAALHEDGAQLSGGHTSEGNSLQVGFAVTGTDKGLSLLTPQKGDRLVLTKPLGVGLIMAAHGQGERRASGLLRAAAVASMEQSNGPAAQVFGRHGAFAMTDVTGFGLARHTLSLLSRGAPGLSAVFHHSSVPVIPGVAELIGLGMASSLNTMNRKAAPLIMETPVAETIYHDPQTGGGLLAAIPSAQLDAVLADLDAEGITAASIGTITADGAPQIRVVA